MGQSVFPIKTRVGVCVCVPTRLYFSGMGSRHSKVGKIWELGEILKPAVFLGMKKTSFLIYTPEVKQF